MEKQILTGAQCLVFFLLLFLTAALLSKTRPADAAGSYDQMWTRVDSLEKKGLSKSVLEQVMVIFQKAKAEKNASQLVKSVIYRLKFQEYTDENSFKKNFQLVKDEAASADYPGQPLLHSMLAEMYWNYYRQNRYRFLQRSKTINFDQQDIETWDLDKISGAVTAEYLLSLRNSQQSKKTTLDVFDPVILKGSPPEARKLRPALYDFLAHRALDFFMNPEPALSKPAHPFEMNSAMYLNDAKTFLQFELHSDDSLRTEYNAIRILQNLIALHQNDQHPGAFIDVDLKRLKFVYEKLTIPVKDSLYKVALQKISTTFREYPGSTEALYELARLELRKGERFNAPADTSGKWAQANAEQICDEALRRFPQSEGGLLCKMLEQQINRKALSFKTEEVSPPDQAMRALLQYRNISKVYLRAVKISSNVTDREDLYGEEFVKRYAAEKPVKSWEEMLPADSDKNGHSVEIKIPGLPLGRYAIFAADNAEFGISRKAVAYSIIDVSNFSVIRRSELVTASELFITDRTSGQPLQHVAVSFYTREYDYKARRNKLKFVARDSSDAEGRVNIAPKLIPDRQMDIELSNSSDHLFLEAGFYTYRNYSGTEADKTNDRTVFFTDRSIYRPGQTIYFKGIILRNKNLNPEIQPGRKTSVGFFDVNNLEIARQEFTTNEFGTFQGTFTAPQGSLNGGMTIRNESGSADVQVEEYKRPKFNVTFSPVKGNYRLNDEVTVTGVAKTFTGTGVDHAVVNYHVFRSPQIPYWYFATWDFPRDISRQEILSGNSVTNDTGGFMIEFTALPDLEMPRESDPTFTYEISADVSDVNGETRSNSTNVRAGFKSLEIEATIADEIDLDHPATCVFRTVNLSGQTEPANLSVSIRRIIEPARLFRKRLWEIPDKHLMNPQEFYSLFPDDAYDREDDPHTWAKEKSFFSTQLQTSTDSILKWPLKDMTQGRYFLTADGKDGFGQPIHFERYFTAYSPAQKELPGKITDLFTVIKDDAMPGENDSILIGSSAKNASAIFEIIHNGNIVKRERLQLDGKQQVLTIPVTEEFRGNFSVQLCFIYHGRFYGHSQLMKVPWENKILNFSFSTFRSELTPGKKEEWRIKISGPGREKFSAELLASMYDKSLDEFLPHNWAFEIFHQDYLSSPFSSLGIGIKGSALVSKDWNDPAVNYKPRIYDQLNWFGYVAGSFGRNNGYVTFGWSSGAGSKAEDVTMMANAPVARSEKIARGDANTAYSQPDTNVPSPKKSQSETTSLRKNLRETAFFFPQLRTDENGDVILAFDAPEALTSWKLQLFAHTKNLEFGLTEKEIITRKTLMVIPNAPRFFRDGDTLIFPVKVTGLSDTTLNGTARLELFDAVTMKPVDGEFGNLFNRKNFRVRKGESSDLRWTLMIPEGTSSVLFRVTAEAGSFSDGEEQVVPVLSNRMLVTESMPVWMRGNEPKTFVLEKLKSNSSTTLTNHKLTFEYTSNPVWYAVQALPYMMEFPYECAEQVFSRYYANTIASYIANSSPRIEAVFNQWKQSSPETFYSNLEKNQELKSVLLEETPWVVESKSESERKKRVALLFDLNRMKQEQDIAFDKLLRAQSPDGGWPWFEGMPEDRYITQLIVTGIGHLNRIGAAVMSKNDKTEIMTRSAVNYLDLRAAQDYYELVNGKFRKEENHLSAEVIQYLYARSYFPNSPLEGDAKKAHSFFIEQAKKFWLSNSEYLQGMIALTLYRQNEKGVCADILKSLKENAIHSEELGMYWKNNRGGYYWQEAPVEAQSLLIEAFEEAGKDTAAADEMKTWLIRQKQTSDWKTTKATADACYALLLRGTAWLSSTVSPEIKIGKTVLDKKKIDESGPEAGTGYFKMSWSKQEITPDMATVTINPENIRGAKSSSTSWGSLYWQYFEQLDKITPHETPLSLKKNIFVERKSATGPVIEPYRQNILLQPGDRIKIRIELRVDRDMEYMHMKDQRASGFEPEEVISGYRYQDGLGYYQSTRDASTDFFFSQLNKGTYVFEYRLRAFQAGNFSNGITTIQCMYAPEFTAHSEGVRVNIKSR